MYREKLTPKECEKKPFFGEAKASISVFRGVELIDVKY